VKQRIGIIDLGSNTVRLIVMEYERGLSFKLINEVSESVRLAEGTEADGRLQAAPMDRAVETLKMFHAFCRATAVEEVVVVGTSAVREAPNAFALIERLLNEAGLRVRVLSGEEEGRYGALAVANTLVIDDGFVIDIGGGSTEVSALRGRALSRSVSYPIGVVRLQERFIRHDPVTKDELRAIERGLQQIFGGLDWYRQAPGDLLVGVGGTIRNLARIDIKRRGYPFEHLHGYTLRRSSLDEIVDELRRRSVRERASIPGLNRERADVILPGALLINYLMRRGGFEQLTVSGAGLREGLFFEHFLAGSEPPRFDDIRAFSILNLARLYGYEQQHCEAVRHLALSLFDQLQPLHRYGPWERELLGAASLIHDIGVAVSYYDHHKHSAYLVLNAALQGFSHREQVLLALLTQYHRKGDPNVEPFAMVLESGDLERVARLAALLRIAEYLERSKSQVVQGVRVSIGADGVRVETEVRGDARVEIWEANRRAGLFRKAFGKEITIV
jgi:exopolyphosphatase / guanosine-5'-triphosphate,3'-diphosphate pyrophosphatase